MYIVLFLSHSIYHLNTQLKFTLHASMCLVFCNRCITDILWWWWRWLWWWWWWWWWWW